MAELILDADPAATPVWRPRLATGSGRGLMWWGRPRQLSEERYGPAYWTAVGLEMLVKEQINDGDVANVAFRFLDGAGTSQLIFSAGVPMEFCGARVSVDTSLAAVAPMVIEYSDDVAAPVWFTASPRIYSRDLGVIRSFDYQFSPTFGVSPLYWRLRRTFGSIATAVTEVWLRMYVGDLQSDFRVWDTRDDGRVQYVHLPASACPSEAQPLNVTQIVEFVPATLDSTAQERTFLDVTAVYPGGESVPLGWEGFSEGGGTLTHAPWIPQRGPYLLQDLITGINQDVQLPGGPGIVEITNASFPVGPGGAFTLASLMAEYEAGGPGGPVVRVIEPGADLYVLNRTAYVMSIPHLGAGRAANKVSTRTNATITITGRGYAHLKLVDANGWWLLEAVDSTGYR